MNFCRFFFVLFLIFTYPPIANANIFDDAGDWAEGAYDDTRKAAEDVEKAAEEAEKEIQKSAEYINEQVVHETEKLSKQAVEGIESAEKAMVDFVKNLTNLGKTCEDSLNKFENKGSSFTNGMPHLPKTLQGLPGTPPALFSQNCQKRQVSGFTCGIFPYLDDIVTAIAQGDSDVKKLSQYVDHAYHSSACSGLEPIAARPECAAVVGIARMSEDSFGCMANVIADIVKNGGGSEHSLPSDFENQICTQLGEFAFASAADKLALGMTEDEEIKRLIKMAKNLQRALRAEEAIVNSERVKNVCKNGAKSDGHTAYKAPTPTDTYADIVSDSPGRHLLLLKDLTSNMCLDGYGMNDKNPRPVQTYGCHGHSNQRWSFHQENNVDGNFFTIKNDRYNTCIEDTGNGLVLKSCDPNRHQQLFTPHHINKEISAVAEDGSAITKTVSKKTGMLRNYHTNNCMGFHTSSAHTEEQLKGFACDDAQLNGIWYVNDPATHLLKSNAGAHINIYANPSAPACLGMAPYEAYKQNDVKSKIPGLKLPGTNIDDMEKESLGLAVTTRGCDNEITQLWSIHSVQNSDGHFAQFWNDKHGPNSCLQDNGKSERYSLAKCDEKNKDQLFTITDAGQIRNTYTENCLQIITGQGYSLTQAAIARDCRNEDGQIWYKVNKQ